MIEVKAPNQFANQNEKLPWTGGVDGAVYVFLGGSIEMGAAEPWQDELVKAFKDVPNVVFLNPRRDDWDSSWAQDPTPGTKFHEQVSWEMDGQEFADIRIYYFADGTKSPITLLELGTHGMSSRTIIRCTPNFWRHGNVSMFAERYDCTLVETLEDVVEKLKLEIADRIEWLEKTKHIFDKFDNSKRFKGIE